MKRWLAVVIAAAALGCGGGESTADEVGAASRSAVSEDDALRPIEYSEWTQSLFPESARSVLLTAGHPDSPDRFVAFGVDLEGNRIAFILVGDLRTQYPALAHEAAAEMVARRDDIGFGGQVPMPLPIPPVPDGEPYQRVLDRAHALGAALFP